MVVWPQVAAKNTTVVAAMVVGLVAGVSLAQSLPCLSRKRRKRLARPCSLSGKVVLKYFDIPALGEPIRMLLVLGNFDWDDDLIEFDVWPSVKSSTKWGQLPVVVTASGCQLAQTKAICRYLATLVEVDDAILYPPVAEIAFVVDEYVDCFDDVQRKLFPTMRIADPAEKEKARAALFADDGDCTALLRKMDAKCGDDGHVVQGIPTLADVWCFWFFRLLKCGFLEGIPVKALARHERLAAVERRIACLPQIKAYYETKARESPTYAAFAAP